MGYYSVPAYDVYGNHWAGQSMLKVGGSESYLSSIFSDVALEVGDSVQIFNTATALFEAYTWSGTAWENDDLEVVGADIPDISVPPATGVFLITSADLVLAGEVPTADATVTVLNGYNLISSAFPVPFNVDNCDWSGIAVGDGIQVFNPATLQFDAITWNGTGWEDDALEPVTGEIAAVGEAFFFVANATGSFVQASPL